jgi:hypothetical protein
MERCGDHECQFVQTELVAEYVLHPELVPGGEDGKSLIMAFEIYYRTIPCKSTKAKSMSPWVTFTFKPFRIFTLSKYWA